MQEINRFQLESQIMDCWNITEDINTIYKQFDIEELDQDTMQNALLGLMTIYNMKFQQMFQTFEDLVKQGKL